MMLADHFPLQCNHGLELRLVDSVHAEKLFNLVQTNRSRLRVWLPWVDVTQNVEDVIQFVRVCQAAFSENREAHCSIWQREQCVGVIGMHAIHWPHRSTSIGYWLGEAFQGKGFATAACASIIDYCFDVLDLHRVEIRVATDNQRSRAVAERLNATLEGVTRQSEWVNDHFDLTPIYWTVI